VVSCAVPVDASKSAEEATSQSQKANEAVESNKENYTQEDFNKSKNSKTAAIFQKHGKLLEDQSSTKEEKKENVKKRNWCCFACCCCCMRKNKN